MTGKEKLEEIVKECETHEITESYAKDVLALIENQDKLIHECQRRIDTATKALKNATAIIKAQPDVVRCKDCIYWKDGYSNYIVHNWLPCIEMQTSANWFCANGKRNIE